MDFTGRAQVAVGVVPVFGYVQDLTSYPTWFSIVDMVVPAGDAWQVDLAARLGPFKRVKRVRMVRSECDVEARRVRFERRELDGGSHSAWVLSGQVHDDGPRGSILEMQLHYGGVGWIPGLDLILREEAKRAGSRLERVLREHGH